MRYLHHLFTHPAQPGRSVGPERVEVGKPRERYQSKELNLDGKSGMINTWTTQKSSIIVHEGEPSEIGVSILRFRGDPNSTLEVAVLLGSGHHSFRRAV